MYIIHELVRVTDPETGEESLVERDRPATPEETAELDAVKAAPRPVPEVVSRFQAKAALFNAGLLTAIDALMADSNTPMLARLAWAEALDFRRDSPTVVTMGRALGISDAQVDDLFRTAAAITA